MNPPRVERASQLIYNEPMKKYLPLLIIVIVVTLFLSVVLFTRSQESLLKNLPYFKESYKNTSLSITSRNGVADIMINDKEYGETPLAIEELTEGRYEVILEKKSSEDDSSFYEPIALFLDLYRNTEAIIDLEIAPGGYKAGYVLYYTPAPQAEAQTGFITVESNSSKSRMLLDGDYYSDLPISVDELEEGEYKMKIESTGYESVEVPIIIRQGYNLNVSTFLLPIPTNLEKPAQPESENSDSDAEAQDEGGAE
ncbi:MAG: PEGA domain-containing protein [Candidatus Dojkabacteria bacterium]|nr:MAG: PEGA domain-containing protein [Candidatus Dojkabacteria bacterium]